MLRVTLGILARNEAAHIGNLILDLSKQTIFLNSSFLIEIHVVANNCTDNTTEVAKKAFDYETFKQEHVTTRVHHLARGGKSNAWNEFIHKLAPADTDYVFLLDGDIRIPESTSLQIMLDSLIASPQAAIAVDRSVKDLSLERPRTLTEWLVKAGTGTTDDTRTAVAGALYCARYAELAKIWMPIGLPGEDGFLRAMILTSSFSHEEKFSRHIYVDDARHIFEAIRDLRGVFRHNVRLAIGSGINFLVFSHVRNLTASGVDIAAYIRDRNLSDPDWINELIRDKINKGAYLPIGRSLLTRRLWQFRRLHFWGKVKRAPVFFVGVLFDIIVYVRANLLMRRGAGAGFW